MTREQKDLSPLNFNNKEVDFNCEKHGQLKVKIFSIGNTWSQASCKNCNEEKKKQTETSEQKRIKESQERDRKERIECALGRSGIPLRFKKHSFSTYQTKTEGMKLKKQICQDYAENFDKKFELGTSMIFCGNTGTGKTHLACSIANHIIQDGRTAVFMNVIRAIRQVKETWSKESNKKEQEAINWFLSPDLLILDEVGVQFGSESEKIILFEILNERYLNIKPTILISNLSIEESQKFIGQRVMDRMKENGGTAIKFDWESNRGS
jgi:DNA replication protein DnaC